MLESLSRLLASIGSSSTFATHRKVAPDDLSLEVKGVGHIRLPISAGTAHKLCAVARPAPHGFKEQTRLDTRVRDTWEISKTRISIDQSRWKKTLQPQLARLQRELGLPEGCRLEAQLHNLLVYAPGQFFAPHQDSEKADNMVGTLIVSLPSQFTGGAIAVNHHDEKIVVGGSAKDLTFIAFYSDCRHEVRPVEKGYRVVLTYNLVVEGDVAPAATPTEQVEALSRCLRKFFDTPRAPRWRGDEDMEPPNRLVYLLDHQYTQRGLEWNRLKNADAARAAALQEAARVLDCEVVLALADVHETWSCEEEDSGYGGHGRYRRWERDDDEVEDDEEEHESSALPELTELLDSDIELRHWVGTSGQTEAITPDVGHRELCYTKPSADLEPFESQHEGFTGNAGNTVEHWYHRAAVVLWPRARTFVIRARASARWGIGEVAATLKTGNRASALSLAQRLLPFWAQAVAVEKKRGLFEATLKVAAKIGDAGVSATLLQPFTLTQLTTQAAPRIAELLGSHGLAWCHKLLRQWSDDKGYELRQTRLAWMNSAMVNLCRVLCASSAADGQALARWILAEQWMWTLKEMQQIRDHAGERDQARELRQFAKPILGLIESSLMAEQPGLHESIVHALVAAATDDPVEVQTHLLRTAHSSYRKEALRGLNMTAIHTHCVQDLTNRLGPAPRASTDWAISPVRCSCKLCATLNRYLCASDQVRMEWPLATEHRAHIHRAVESHDLPVTHTTRRTGRPFTLVLAKTDAVFKRAAAEREFWQEELEWLTKTAPAWGAPVRSK